MTRKRKRQIHIMLTDEEYIKLSMNARELNMRSISEYIRKIALSPVIVNVNFSELNSFKLEINKIGINLNQIAKKLNTENQVKQELYSTAKSEIDELKNVTYAENIQRGKYKK